MQESRLNKLLIIDTAWKKNRLALIQLDSHDEMKQ